MSQTLFIVLSFLFLVGMFALTRYGVAWKLRRSTLEILRELEAKGAVGPSTAVTPYCVRSALLKIGTRDYQSQALKAMVNDGVVGKTPDGRYYLTGLGSKGA